MIPLIEAPGHAGVPDAFVDLPREIYADDPWWPPESPDAVGRAFSRDNPWFEENRAVTFTVPGRARAAGFANRGCFVDGAPSAFFGYWESTGDLDSDRRVMQGIERWARSQGAGRLVGPIDFTTYQRYRLRTEAGDDGRPFPGEPYNPPWYPARVEALGFEVLRRYVSQISRLDVLGPLLSRLAPSRERLDDAGYRIEPLTHELWLSRLDELHGIVDAIFREGLAYTPLSPAAFRLACGPAFIETTSSDCSVVAFAPDRSLAAFFLVTPDGDRLILKTLGVHPAHRRRGLMEALTLETITRGASRYRTFVGALMREDNPSLGLARGHTIAEREYALYHKLL